MFVNALAILPNIGLGWTIAIVIAVIGIVLTICEHFYLEPREAYNKSWGLPKDWEPPEFYGPGTDDTIMKKTPKGIKVYPDGFDRDVIPKYARKYGYDDVMVRIDYETIDEIWASVRQTLSTNPPSTLSSLTKAQRKKIAELPDNFPTVHFWPTVRWEQTNDSYVAGLTLIDEIYVAIFYITTIHKYMRNWKALVAWEFQNVALIAAGRNDLAK